MSAGSTRRSIWPSADFRRHIDGPMRKLEGGSVRAIVGALIMTVIRSGCAQMGLPNWVQEMVTGFIIVLAVAIDRWRQRRRA